jgi:prepilin-type N-terminal cleavage/methylation domain-containing protein
MKRVGRGGSRRGLTLVELIVAFTILLIISTMALPVAKVKVQREKERRLRTALYEMRSAIDRYKDAADAGLLGQVDPDTHGYPPSLEVLVEGVEANAAGAGLGGGQFGGAPGSVTGQSRGPQTGGSFGNRNSRDNSRNSQRSGGFGSRQGQSNSRSSGGFGSRDQNSNRNQSGSRGGTGFGDDEDEEGQKLRFLRKIPIDPMTGSADWGMRSVTDPPDAMSWGSGNVFDVYSLSRDSSMDGEYYGEW